MLDGSVQRTGRTAALVVALVLLLPSWQEAHEIPADVIVTAFVKLEATTVRLLVRAPLAAMRDYDFPLRGPELLDIAASETLVREAAVQWLGDYVEMHEGEADLGKPSLLAVRVSAPGDRAFQSYQTALTNLESEPLSERVELPWRQAMLDVLFEWRIGSANSDFSIDPRFAHLGQRTVTVLRFLPEGGAERAFQYTGNPGLVRLDPRWHQAMLRFVALGFKHILDGIDHLLFLFCLVLPVRSLRRLIPIVTSFTVAHSITLIASVLGVAPRALWFPVLIESLIALSIVYMAFENILGAKLNHRWKIAFAFGLVHGFGFSFALSESLQFAGAHLITSLLSFNVGVELGQLVVLAFTVPALHLLFRKALPEVMGTILLSAIIAHTSWHWMIDRTGRLLQYNFRVPTLDAVLGPPFLRWVTLALIISGALWLLSLAYRRLGPSENGMNAD